MLFKNKNFKKFTAVAASVCMIGASSIFTACAASAESWKSNVGSINLDTMEVTGLGIAADGTDEHKLIDEIRIKNSNLNIVLTNI